MRVLYIGGSGEISFDCIHESVRLGHDVSVFNRGRNNAGLPRECRFITGDVEDNAAYSTLAAENFDVICQFRLFTPASIQRDIALFTGHCRQYVFISSASAYEKATRNKPITEDTPLNNPHWAYSRDKAAMEAVLRGQTSLSYTIVRPSHTFRTKIPTALGGEVSRLLRGKPVIIHGDGTSLWTITHASDFARPFARLLGNDLALNEIFHITSERSWTWNDLFASAALALDVERPGFVHVASDTLIRYRAEWEGPLLGDKSASVMFDNSKVKRVAGDFSCIDPIEGMRRVVAAHPPRADTFDAGLDGLYDRIISDVGSLGG